MKTDDKPPRLDDIARRITAHLKRLEADPEYNVRNSKYKTVKLYNAGACRAGRYVSVRYISYQGSANLTMDRAQRYLEALDSGYQGTHYSWEAGVRAEADKLLMVQDGTVPR